MRTVLAVRLGLVARLGRSRRDLLLEDLALRHQLAMCERRPRVTNADRVLWAHLVRRGRIEYRNVTAHPTAAWTWQQLVEGTAWNQRPATIRDRDRVYGRDFVARAQRLGIETVLTPVRAPQANAVAERWIGTLRRERLDHIIPLNERHLRRIVRGREPALSPDGSLLATSHCGEFTGEVTLFCHSAINLWDAGTGEPIAEPIPIRVQAEFPPPLAFSPAGRLLAIGRGDGSVPSGFPRRLSFDLNQSPTPFRSARRWEARTRTACPRGTHSRRSRA